MRIWKYMKIDCMKVKSYLFMFVVFPAIVIALMLFSENPSPLFGVMYCLFAGVILAPYPFYYENGAENGFLKMLPGKPGDDIKGHFLYSFCVIMADGILGILAVYLASLLRPEAGLADDILLINAFPIMLGVALLFAGLEDLLMCFVKSNNGRILQLLRVVPAFIFLFGGSSLIEYGKELESFLELIVKHGWITWLFCFCLFLVMAFISSSITGRRDDL